MRTLARTALAATAALVIASTAARADIITILNSSTLQSNGLYAYTYGVQLTMSSMLIGTAQYSTNQDGTRAANPIGNGEYGTVYDFGPIVANGAGQQVTTTGLMPFNFTFSNTSTPTATNSVVDDPAIGNIRFTYNQTNTVVYIAGETPAYPAGTAQGLPVAAGPSNLGTFTVLSSFSPADRFVSYDGVSQKSTNNLQQVNSGFTSAPNLTPVRVPEPASLAILGMGLLGLGVARRRKMI